MKSNVTNLSVKKKMRLRHDWIIRSLSEESRKIIVVLKIHIKKSHQSVASERHVLMIVCVRAVRVGFGGSVSEGKWVGSNAGTSFDISLL